MQSCETNEQTNVMIERNRELDERYHLNARKKFNKQKEIKWKSWNGKELLTESYWFHETWWNVVEGRMLDKMNNFEKSIMKEFQRDSGNRIFSLSMFDRHHFYGIQSNI
jgi:hypothetical protein